MVTLTNECQRGLGIPGHGEQKSLVLVPGASVEITDEHHAHLVAEVPGVSAFFDMKKGGIRVTLATPKASPVMEAAVVPAASSTSSAGEDAESLGLGDDEPTEENTAPAPAPKSKHRKR